MQNPEKKSQKHARPTRNRKPQTHAEKERLVWLFRKRFWEAMNRVGWTRVVVANPDGTKYTVTSEEKAKEAAEILEQLDTSDT